MPSFHFSGDVPGSIVSASQIRSEMHFCPSSFGWTGSNRGPGIPPTQRAHVFEPFFRGRAHGPGAGLGLAISRGFVEANGGRLVLQSGANGETAFAVTLPAARAPVAS